VAPKKAVTLDLAFSLSDFLKRGCLARVTGSSDDAPEGRPPRHAAFVFEEGFGFGASDSTRALDRHPP